MTNGLFPIGSQSLLLPSCSIPKLQHNRLGDDNMPEQWIKESLYNSRHFYHKMVNKNSFKLDGEQTLTLEFPFINVKQNLIGYKVFIHPPWTFVFIQAKNKKHLVQLLCH